MFSSKTTWKGPNFWREFLNLVRISTINLLHVIILVEMMQSQCFLMPPFSKESNFSAKVKAFSSGFFSDSSCLIQICHGSQTCFWFVHLSQALFRSIKRGWNVFGVVLAGSFATINHALSHVVGVLKVCYLLSCAGGWLSRHCCVVATAVIYKFQ